MVAEGDEVAAEKMIAVVVAFWLIDSSLQYCHRYLAAAEAVVVEAAVAFEF